MTYQPKVYRKQGGDTYVVASGGKLQIETGGALVPNSGTQATNITTFTATATFSTAIAGRINSLITACAGAGIHATA